MNIKFYNCNTKIVYNLGERFKTLKDARDDCIAQLKQTYRDAYVDELGLIHYVHNIDSEENDSVFGVFFMHYRNLWRRLCKAIEKRGTVNWIDDDWSYWIYYVSDICDHIRDMNVQKKSCTSTTPLLRVGFDSDADVLEYVECMSNTPRKHAEIEIGLFNNTRKPTNQMYIDQFGLVHHIEYYRNMINDAIISMYVDENDLDDAIGNLGELLDDMWRGKPIVIDPQTHYAAAEFYELLVTYRDGVDTNQ